MKRTCSGLTLLELLLAVSLLSGVVLGSGWWISESTRRAKATTQLLATETAVTALLDAIERDVTLGDLSLPATKGPRVRVDGDGVSVVTRSAAGSLGAVVHEYSFRPSSGEVLFRERAADAGSDRGAAASQRVVLGGVTALTPIFDEKARTLALEIATTGGRTLARRWVLP